MWDAATGEPVGAPLQHQNRGQAAAFSPDGRRVVTASWRRHRARLGRRHRPARGRAPPDTRGASIGRLQSRRPPRRHRLRDDTARVWDATPASRSARPSSTAWVIAAVFSPDGRRIVTASWTTPRGSGTPATGQPVARRSSTKAQCLRGLQSRRSPHRHRLRGQHRAGVGRRHRPARRRAAPARGRSSPRPSVPTGAASSPPPMTIRRACGTPPPASVGTPLQHQGNVLSAAFSPDGRRIVTASDNTARVWDAPPGQPVGAPLQHQSAVASAAFSPDGRRIVTASDDNTARVWDAATGQPVGAPLQHQDMSSQPSSVPTGAASSPPPTTHRARLGRRHRPAVGAPLQHQAASSPPSSVPTGAARHRLRDNRARLGRRHRPARRRAAAAPGALSLRPPSVPTGAASSPPPTTRPRASGTPPLASPSARRSGTRATRKRHSAAFSPDGRRVVTAS